MPTLDNLIKRGLIIPIRCCMCGCENESANHLLLHCREVATIWGILLVRFLVQWVFPGSLRELLSYWPFQHIVTTNQLAILMWKFVPPTILWTIWEECNQRSFNGI